MVPSYIEFASQRRLGPKLQGVSSKKFPSFKWSLDLHDICIIFCLIPDFETQVKSQTQNLAIPKLAICLISFFSSYIPI